MPGTVLPLASGLTAVVPKGRLHIRAPRRGFSLRLLLRGVVEVRGGPESCALRAP